ncbi:MAG: hypothetical protein ACPG6P_13860 [Akkermansiaceae bacterium]
MAFLSAYCAHMASEIKHIADFPDKLNPMVVKELRQGLRGVSFVILFIAIQAFLCLILLSTAAAASYANAGALISRTIFFFFAVAVLVVQPLRGISALSGEIKGNTIDLLCMTRLSAWRITFGKWCSIMSQSALILTAIIPYLILRYFFGDMQLFSELLLLLSVFLLAAVMTAFTVGFSALNSIILRVLLPLCVAFGLLCFTWIFLVSDGRHLFPDIVRALTLRDGQDKLVYLAFVIGCVYSAWMLLDLGTSMIAPIAENRATMRRLVSAALIAAILVSFYLADAPYEAMLMIGLVLCLPVSIISVTESHQLVPPVTAPFVRKGVFGRLAGRILYPGWATGLLFVLMLYGLLTGMIFLYQSQGKTVDHEFITTINSVFASMMMSLVLVQLFAKQREKRFQYFLLFVISQFLIITVIYAAEEFNNKLHIVQYFCWIPASFVQLLDGPVFTTKGVTTISYINMALYSFLSLAMTGSAWKHIRETEKSLTQ